MKNKFKKILGNSLLVGALASNVFAEDKTPYFFDLSGAAIYESKLINKVENIPFKIRNIEYPSNIQNIEKDNIKYNEGNPIFKTRIGKKFYFNENTKVRFGVGLDFILDLITNTNEGDYTTLKKISCVPESWDKEGIYYNMHPTFLFNKNKWVRPNIFSEVEFKIKDINKESSEFEQLNLVLGYKLHNQSIIAENGYVWKEYYSGDEEYRSKNKYDLVDLIIGGPYTSLKLDLDGGGVFLDFGLSKIIKKDFSKLGKQVDFKFNNLGWYVGGGINIYLDALFEKE